MTILNPEKYTALPPANVPLSGEEVTAVVQDGESRQVSTKYVGQNSAGYVLVADNGYLTNARVLTAGANVVINDGGPGENLVISASAGAGTAIVWSTIQQETLPAGNTNNLILDDNTQVLLITPNAGGSSLTGIDSTLNDGRVVLGFNVGAGLLTLSNATGSDPGNQFNNVGGNDVIVAPGGKFMAWCDSINSVWRTF